MKQIIRSNTFETNSSSLHTLVLMSKEDFEKFKYKELFMTGRNETFVTKEEIITSEEFKKFCPNYDEYNDKAKEDKFKEFSYEYMDTDYAEYYSYGYLDTCEEKVFDKDGNEQVALSIYIGDC